MAQGVSRKGAEAQSGLGKIARAHRQRIVAVGHVEEDLGPLPRLSIFIGDVRRFAVMSNGFQMIGDGGFDVDFMDRCPHFFHENVGIGVGPLARSKAGPGHGDAHSSRRDLLALL